MTVVAYLAGLLTVPVLAAVYWLGLAALSRGNGLECICGRFDIPMGTTPRVILWLRWRWHRATVGRTAWHRQLVAEWAARRARR